MKMKLLFGRYLKLAAFASVLLPSMMKADITWNTNTSSHEGPGGGFNAVTGPGVPPGTGVTGSSPFAYGGGQNNSGVFTFGFTNSTNPTPGFADTELASTVLTAGTRVALIFDKAPTDVINYIAVVADTTASVRYRAISATQFEVLAYIVNPVASASGDANAAFGLVIDYQSNPALNFMQTVFATDMHHFDISPPAVQTGGVAAINANGVNGTAAQFRAFMPTSYLASIGLTDPAQCKGYVDGIETPPGDFTNEGLDDSLGFNFMDAGNPTNEVLKVVIDNDAWSAHDVQFGRLAPVVDPNIAKRASLRKKISRIKKRIRRAKSSSKKRRLKRLLQKYKRQLRRL